MENKAFRYERKFLTSAVDEYEAVNFVLLHPAFFREAFPTRFVNNIYLDTENYQYYYDNVEGSSNREKARIRWYGNLFGLVENPVLEFKIKQGLQGTKDQFRLAPFTFQGGFSGEDLRKIFHNSRIPNDAKIKVDNLSPTLVNRYSRKYFLSSDRLFRITIDSQMSFWMIENNWNEFSTKRADDYNIVVELKYENEYDQHIERISNYFPFRMTKNSKYVNGLCLTRGNLSQ